MSEDPDKSKAAAGGSVDKSRGVEIDGQTFYPLATATPALNPCAGKENGTSCGAGCVCRNGQCYYALFRLRQMGISIPD